MGRSFVENRKVVYPKGYRHENLDMPDLIKVQKDSYEEFLQEDIHPEDRKKVGLHAVYSEVFPIISYDETLTLEYVRYNLGVPKYSIIECKRRGMTYSVPLSVTFRLKESEQIKEETVYMGNIPKMTEQGTFVINGAERVIVSQLHRSPGVCFEKEIHPGGMTLYSSRIIPYRGSWLEAQFTINDEIYFFLDRLKRRRKVLATTFLRAIGYSSAGEVLGLFFKEKKIKVTQSKSDELIGSIVFDDIRNPQTGEVVIEGGKKILKTTFDEIISLKLKEISLAEDATSDHPIIKMMDAEESKNMDDALKEIYKKMRPGDPPTISNAKALVKRLFFDSRYYDLGKVGRYKLDIRLGISSDEVDLKNTTLKKEDVVEILRSLISLHRGEGALDDIDHLGNRRIRSVGELLQNQCRVGLARMERVIKERMNLFDLESDTITPHKLINPKALSTVVKDFFGRSQLSQFMDQTNPLSELTHKRRLSALGPGGLNRERAGFEVRDVHTSHYGRICPIETPEGPNIGLISSLSIFAKVNNFGFIETPYRKVIKNRVTDEIAYLAADQEEKHVIAQASAPINEKGVFQNDLIWARKFGEFYQAPKDEIEYMDVSARQLVSVAAGLIPFLEHDDANRALMGSNMQRQAVPLLTTEVPFVGTGIEERAAKDSGVCVVAKKSGTVTYVDSLKIVIDENQEYELQKFGRSNAGTCVNQRPLVKIGDKIKAGDVIADGLAVKDGNLSLGRNVLVAYMPWEGYNFEDAIIISERIVKDDVYTSVHVEEFEVGARDTKLGKEEITADIPGVSEEARKNLGEDGVIQIGSEVKPGDILVGKITPKSETELSPEERLLRAIFGEKAADVRDASLTVPPGVHGIVIDVKAFARKEKTSDEDKNKDRKKLKEINEYFTTKEKHAREVAFDQVRELLLNQKLTVDIVDSETGEILVKEGAKVTKSVIENLESRDYSNLEMKACTERKKLRKLLWEFKHELDTIQTQKALEIEKVKKGDELEPGMIKKVKVYVASKRKLSVGDKMAGRHGNKGVIARVVPEADMPYLENGQPIDIILNPLGVPSRMNVGQIMETQLGWAAKMLDCRFVTPVFEGLTEQEIEQAMIDANLDASGKVHLWDGRNGERFDQKIIVGYIYMLKLNHLSADKIHARATGPYSLVTQQPLGGKAQFGGQRFGEMEVWALEAYGAAYTLQELLTVKSDDVVGRTRMYESIVKGDNVLDSGTPESFNVLMKELQSLCLDVNAEKEDDIQL